MLTAEALLRRNNVLIQGRGETTIVFAHGFGCDQTMWQWIEPSFRPSHRTILFDLVGSGKSDTAAYDMRKYATLHGYAADLVEIIATFGQGPVAFVGHSVGAMIGMLAGLEAPSLIAAQVMIGPSPCFVNDDGYVGGFSRADIEALIQTMDDNYLVWAESMAPAIMGAPDQPALGGRLTESFCRTDPDIAKHFARVTFLSDHRAELASVRIPTLVLQSHDDFIAPVVVGEYVHRHISESHLAIIRNVGHCPHVSAPHACTDQIVAFLSGISFP